MGNGQPSKIGEKNPKFVRNGQTYNNCGKWSNSLNLWEMLKQITIVGNGQNIKSVQKMVKQPKIGGNVQTFQILQGWAPHSFLFGTFRSFPFFKKKVPFFSILFLSFWQRMRPKRMFRSCPFFSKERKRMQRTQRSCAKKVKERKERNILLQRT